MLDVVKPVDRCILTTRAQPGGVDRDLDVLRTINKELAGELGVGTMVVAPGRIAVGDELTSSLTGGRRLDRFPHALRAGRHGARR